MASIVCICKMFPVLDWKGNDTGRKELLVDYALDLATLRPVIVPCDHPSQLGAVFDRLIEEWVIHE